MTALGQNSANDISDDSLPQGPVVRDHEMEITDMIATQSAYRRVGLMKEVEGGRRGSGGRGMMRRGDVAAEGVVV